jgi:hypothetical protein
MKKIIFRLIYLLLIFIILFLCYFSIFGFETKKLNNQVQNKVKNINQDLEIELNKIKLIFDPLKLQIKAKTLGAKLKHNNETISFGDIQTKISLLSLIENKFLLTDVKASTKSIEVKNLVLFIQSLNQSAELFIFEKFIKKGYLIADIKLNFDENGNLKDNFKINGFIKDVKINIINKYKIKNLNFIFNLQKEELKINDFRLSLNDLKFLSNKLNIVKINNEFKVTGEIENKDLKLKNDEIDLLFKKHLPNIKIKKIKFRSKNNFSFKIDERFKLKDFEIKSKINLKEFLISNNFLLDKIFSEAKEDINFLDQKLEIQFKRNNLSIIGSGNLKIQNNKDKISYLIKKNNKTYYFDTVLEIIENPLNINFLNYIKNEKTNAIIKLKGSKELKKQTKFSLISLEEKNNKVKIKDLIFDKKFKIIDLDNVQIDILDKEENINKFNIIKKKNNYHLKGTILNANNIIKNLLSDGDFPKILNKSFKIFIQIEKLLLDQNYNLNDFKGNLLIKNQEIIDGNLIGSFSNNKTFNFSVKSKGDQKITTLFVEEAEALVNRYKFIKGFKGGALDFYSSKQNNMSVSKIKIYDFKLKELPALTKLLTLASLQGIADLLSGDGIGFDEFEMSFENKKNLMTIDEIYAIGPAISILMNGYVEKNDLISLRGTLVPATTINKAIGSIPILGQILVGSKTGEGVFGVSFKIKGPPKNLETTVNPIKTLTPRFITRTLEKIKKN